jgi:hypothetical protein
MPLCTPTHHNNKGKKGQFRKGKKKHTETGQDHIPHKEDNHDYKRSECT